MVTTTTELSATQDTLRNGFARLRDYTHEDGHDLLDALEETCLTAVTGLYTGANMIHDIANAMSGRAK